MVRRDRSGERPRRTPPLHRDRRPPRANLAQYLLDLELLEHRIDRDDVTLELQLRLVQAGRDPDELGEVEDRHLEVLARRLLQLRLPRVEREMAERARRDDRVRACLLRLLDRLDQLA